MESWKLLEIGIGRGHARTLARILGRSEDLINKWKRPPRTDEKPTATGTRNPVDVLDDIFDFMLIYSPAAARIMADRYRQKLDRFLQQQKIQPLTDTLKQRMIADALRENAEAIAVLIEGADISAVRKEWEEAKMAIEDIVRSLEFVEGNDRTGGILQY